MLHELLLRLFGGNPDGLRRFIRHGEAGEHICNELPGPKASLAELVERAIDELTKHDLVRLTLGRLRADFPRRASEIDRVAEAFPEPAGAAPSFVARAEAHVRTLELVAPGDARRRFLRALLGEPNAILQLLGARLGLDGPAPGESSEAFASRLAAALDELGAGPDATTRLVEACYAALSAVDARERPGARRVLQSLLGEWLPQRYGCTVSATPIHRTTAPDRVEDLDVDTPNREIVEPAAAFADQRRATYATRTVVRADGTRERIVGPRGEISVSLAEAAEILTVGERAARIADAIADQIPSPVQTTPKRRLQDTREYLVFLRDPGLEHGPKHIALTAEQRDDLGDEVLLRLKDIFPALRIVCLGERPGPEEAKIRFRLVTIFKDDV